MIAATIAPLLLANGDPSRAVMLASPLAVLVGVVMAIAGLAGSGSLRTCCPSRPRSAILTGWR